MTLIQRRPRLMGLPPTNPSHIPSAQTMLSTLLHTPLNSSMIQSPAATKGMTSASKYSHNLKVIRRRNPDIISIFDQFSYVCIYTYEDGKWHKHGHEGSMFLCERSVYPPYALYILNRVGMDDYVQMIYPEDEINQSGKFVIIKSYPDFVSQRMAHLPPGQTLDKFSPLYHIPNINSIPKEQKGPCVIKGLWMHTIDNRMMETMTGLLSYVRLNQPYPEALKYPNAPTPGPRMGFDGNYYSDSQFSSQSDNEGYQSDARSTASNGLSDVDKLFAKLAPPPSAPSAPRSPQPAQTSSILLNTLFSSVQSTGVASIATPPPPPAPSNKDTLLAAMFASAAQTPPPTSTPIYAPNPTTSPPQVLNQNVLSTLLGIPPPTRTASAASSISISAVSHPSSREGDNEDDGESDSPNTIFSREDNLGVVSNRARHDLLNTFGLPGPRQGAVHGDVTPRPPMNGVQRLESTSSSVTARHTTVVGNEKQVAPSQPAAKPRANRTLVPFEPDSELWPYSRVPAQDNSSDADDNSEIIELSFEDTSLLSDPAAFDKIVKNQKGAPRSHHTNGHGTHHASEGPDNRKGKKNKKNKKSDAREREEIEKSWDVPPAPASTMGSSQADGSFRESLSSSPSEDAHPIPEMKTPTMTAKMTLSAVNGHSNGAAVLAKGKGKAINGKSSVATNGHSTTVDSNTALGSILAAMETQPYPTGRMGKSDFIREVLTLINTDKAFVDTLYQQYMARLA